MQGNAGGLAKVVDGNQKSHPVDFVLVNSHHLRLCRLQRGFISTPKANPSQKWPYIVRPFPYMPIHCLSQKVKEQVQNANLFIYKEKNQQQGSPDVSIAQTVIKYVTWAEYKSYFLSSTGWKGTISPRAMCYLATILQRWCKRDCSEMGTSG